MTASFDCTKASTNIEKAICSIPELSDLDEILGRNYSIMRSSNIGDNAKEDLLVTQRQWISSRNQCDSIECLKETYTLRINQICSYPVISGIYPACVTIDSTEDLNSVNEQTTPQQSLSSSTMQREAQNTVSHNICRHYEHLMASSVLDFRQRGIPVSHAENIFTVERDIRTRVFLKDVTREIYADPEYGRRYLQSKSFFNDCLKTHRGY